MERVNCLAFSVLVVGLLAWPTSGSSQATMTVPAYAAPDGGVVFDSPIPISWDSLAPMDLRLDALEADSIRVHQLFIDQNMWGHTEVVFTAPLAAELGTWRYYLLASTGVYEVRPTGLQGTTRISWRQDGTRIENVRHFGSLHAPVPSPGSQGFVLITPHPVTLQVDSSNYSPDDLMSPDSAAYAHQGTSFWSIERQYTIRQTAPSAQRWTWVRWMPDTELVEVGCTERYALFSWDPDPVLVASLNAGCDV